MQRLLAIACSLIGPASAFSGGVGIAVGKFIHRRIMSPPASVCAGAKTTSSTCIALRLSSSADANDGVDFDSLLDMDVVLFKRRNSEQEEKLEIGAMQEDGTVSPVSAWSLESAFATGSSDSIEFLVDEEDRFPGLTADDIVIVSVVDESLISYGSRQVGGGKGPGNPHGEESELLYYVERSVVEEDEVDVVINPELEILW
mmetsp:Transcript_28722/g.83270  ORF Transcript_28722/g.83270 Transcript_28722/m.83270 type:complete len:201 (-) Transcript_28722:1355-1957(-)